MIDRSQPIPSIAEWLGADMPIQSQHELFDKLTAIIGVLADIDKKNRQNKINKNDKTDFTDKTGKTDIFDKKPI